MQGRYVDALIRELDLRYDYIAEPVKTIYLGGGTPSLLSPDNMRRLTKALLNYAQKSNGGKSAVEEFTVECNPDDIDRGYAELLVECGVTRVSMGVQSFSDRRLRFLHRRHNADNVIFAVRALRAAEIKNISIDLMFGFPGETMDDWENDISRAIRLDVEHISAYSLMYEEGTPLSRMLEEGVIEEIDDDLSRKMYDRLVYRMTSADYEHYEISNFGRPGFRSRHNSSYWNDTPYLGLGAAAHSYNGDSRQWNVSDVILYMDAVLNGESEYVEQIEHLTDCERYNDMITTAMRTSEGIDSDEICHRYHLPQKYQDFFLQTVKSQIDLGLIQQNGTHYSLTQEGLYVSDSVMSELIYEES